MKVLMVLLPLFIVGLGYLLFKKDGNKEKFIISILLVVAIFTFALAGNIMRAVAPLFVAHFLAIFIAYGATIFYIVKERIVWLALLAPLATMLLYLVLVWVGNEHLPSIF